MATCDRRSLIAARTAIESNTPSSAIHISDTSSDYVNACRERLERLGVSVEAHVGRAEEVVHDVVDALHPSALHFAFLDPFGLEALPFSVVPPLASMERMDLLIHVNAMPLRRNPNYRASADSPVDRFFPGWRDHVIELPERVEYQTRLFGAL